MELTVRQAQPADLEDIQAMYRDLVARMDREGWKIWSDRYPPAETRNDRYND